MRGKNFRQTAEELNNFLILHSEEFNQAEMEFTLVKKFSLKLASNGNFTLLRLGWAHTSALSFSTRLGFS